MAVENVAAEILFGGRAVGSGLCHLLSRDGAVLGGTISQLHWLGNEPDLSGEQISLRIDDERQLEAVVARHGHPEGKTILRVHVVAEQVAG